MIHGHKKAKKQKPQEQIDAEEERSEKINAKLKQFFAIRKKDIQINQIPALLEFTTILMQLCSDIPTIFNYRRQLLIRLFENIKDSQQQKLNILLNDYKLNTKIIQSDQKSYTLWSHRQWLIVNLYEIDKTILDKQRQLCKKLLMKDEKNFHVWNYRSWLNSIYMNLTQQIVFTQQKIKENPFNFSPYHFRTKYLTLKYEKDFQSEQCIQKEDILMYGMPKHFLDTELQSIQTAIFLNPKQQAPWNYYNWLIQQFVPIILLSKSQKQNICELVFSCKISNPNSIICGQNNQLKVYNKQNTALNNIWIIKNSKQINFTSNQIQKLSRQNPGKYLVTENSQNQKVNIIKKLLKQQSNFVKEVIQSEENKCRYGWLQLISINKALLMCGCMFNEWDQIVNQTLSIFDHLKDQTKTEKYVQKIRQYWIRISNNTQLTNEEMLLKNYMKK